VPTYQYACTECGQQVEAVQKFSDDPLTVCSNCGGRLRKVFSPVGFVFKGSGFYRTDSRNNSSSSSAPAKASDNGAASADKADKKDSKPAEKKSTESVSTSSSSSEKVA
jgi:putative FmdB family regulatory protein